MPGGSRSKSAAGGGSNAQAVVANAERLAVIENMKLSEMQSGELFQFLLSKIPGIKIYEAVWLLSGAQLAAFPPSSFVRALQMEFLSFSFSLGVEIFKIVQKKIVDDHQTKITSGAEGQDVADTGAVNAWANAAVPSIHNSLGSAIDFNSINSNATSSVSQNSFGANHQVSSSQNSFGVNPQVSSIQNYLGINPQFSSMQNLSGFNPQSTSAIQNLTGAANSNFNIENLVSKSAAEQVVPRVLENCFTPAPLSFQSFGNVNAGKRPSSVKNKFVIGGPRAPLQNSLVSNLLFSGSNPQLFQNLPALTSSHNIQVMGQIAASAAQASSNNGQIAASAAQLPSQNSGQNAASAAQLPFQSGGQNAASAVQSSPQGASNVGQNAASAAQYPMFASPVQFSPALMGTNAPQLVELLSNPLIQNLFHSVQAQSKRATPMMPWEIAALSRPFVQDPSMPIGYKRLSMAVVIASAKAERARIPGAVDTAKAIVWPEMITFNKSEFIRVRKEYYAAVKKSSQSGLISTFKSCMTLVARNSAMGVFGLDDLSFGTLEDEQFMSWCALLFGPANKKEAIRRLQDVRMYHRDSEHPSNSFLAKFDVLCYEHEAVVNDIVDSQHKWPLDEEDIECSGLTEKDIRKEWRDTFPKQDGKIFSAQLRQCRIFIEHNMEMPYNEQVKKLRAYFVKKDHEAEEQAAETRRQVASYSNQPSDQRNSKSSNGAARGVAFGGITNQPTQAGGGAKRSRNSNSESTSKRVKRIVPGHERGLACGSLNNHYGLGCHKDTCPAFGTEYDKSRNGKVHVWKSSEDEESVRMPNDVYNERLKSNPKILENWKQASHAIKGKGGAKHSRINPKVAAFTSNDVADDMPNQDEIDALLSEDEDYQSESNDYDDEVNPSHYFDEDFGCDVAAARAEARITDAFTELGHEEQFYAVTRFASNDDFKTRTLMDPGATINIICPMLANRSALQRKQLAVNIFQGKRKMAAVEEMVQCAFELQGLDGVWHKHREWFAVCDLGYDILLGRRFCRVQKFTSFDTKLMHFDSLPAAANGIAVAAFDSEQRLMLRFNRVPATEGFARYKRQPKAVSCIANCSETSIGKDLLTTESKHGLANLDVTDRRILDGKESVLLTFTVDTLDRKGTGLKQHWFPVVEGCELKVSDRLVNKFMSDSSVLIALKTVVRQREAIDDISSAVEHSTELSDEEVAKRQREVAEKARIVKKENALRFASYHPVRGYRLQRNAEKPPLSEHWTKDHKNYEAQRDFRGERARVQAAVDAKYLEKMCRIKRSSLKAMLNTLSSVPSKERGVSANVDCWLDQLALEINEKSPACVGNDWKSDFKSGEYVEIQNAIVKPEFNGQRVRIFGQTDDVGVWVIRVLGKDGGKRRCNESLFKKLELLQQQQSVPSGAQAGFDDVGIDDAGLPNIELKSLAHRQFGEEYSAELTQRIEKLKALYPTVFTTDVSEPCDFEPMKIRLIPNAVLPSKARFYRNTPKMREEVRRQIKEQLDWGAIRKCTTSCVSDVLLVKRPHMPGKFRFVVSYVKLNDATVKEQLLMPDPKSQYERLAGCEIFGAFDYSSYYRQIRLHEDSQYLTGFASDEGTFCYTRVPMGITGACGYAQKVLQDALAADEVLGPLGFRNFFDDLPFGAKTPDEFMFRLKAFLDFNVKWKLKVNPEKTVLGVTSITHVGFVVSKHGVSIDPERTRDIRELTAPKSIKKVQSILGIFNYVRNFVPDFSGKAKFLSDKLSTVLKVDKQPLSIGNKRSMSDVAAISVAANKSKAKVKVLQNFVWSEDDQKKFEELKSAVLNAPLLSQLDYSKPIYIRCDASRFGCGAVLFQYDDRGYEHPVCYASRKFLPAERNWSTFSQEASTVVWALERFSEYTQGYHVIVECDHRNISFVKKSAMPQLARWRLRLQDTDFSVRYLAGPQNLVSDGLSRQHVDEIEVGMSDLVPECALAENNEALSADIAAFTSVFYRFKETQIAEFRVDEQSRKVSTVNLEPTEPLLKDGVDVEDEVSLASEDSSVFSEYDDFADELDDVAQTMFGPNGELLSDDGQPLGHEEQQPAHLVVPLMDASDEIKAVHNDLLGHAGTYVTLQRALRNGRIWGSRKQMLQDVDNFILGCPCCQKMRKRSSKSRDERRVISGSPFAELSVDLLKLPKPDAFGNAYVVVIVDNFSHWTSLIAVKSKSVYEAARALMKVIGDFGVPMRIRSDGGGEFVNGVIAGLVRMMGPTHHTVVPYTPEANGIVERANRSILERLRAMIFSQRLVRHPQHVWSDLLPLVQRSINASVHSATGTSPARILFGDNLDLDRCLLTRMPNARVLDVSRYVDALTFNQRVIMEEADKHQSELCKKVIEASRRKQSRKQKDGRVVELPFKELQVGDWVLVSPSDAYPLHKLAPRWLGPFRIIECSSDSEVVVVEDTLKRKVRKFLRRQLELFDITHVADVEGLKKVAESDGFEFPIEAIIGHALIEEGGVGVSPVQLPASFKRGVRPKRKFQFLVKWTGYEEPTWIEYKVASRLVQFPGYVAFLPNLRMD